MRAGKSIHLAVVAFPADLDAIVAYLRSLKPLK